MMDNQREGVTIPNHSNIRDDERRWRNTRMKTTVVPVAIGALGPVVPQLEERLSTSRSS